MGLENLHRAFLFFFFFLFFSGKKKAGGASFFGKFTKGLQMTPEN